MINEVFQDSEIRRLYGEEQHRPLLNDLEDIDKDNPKTSRFLNLYVKPCSAIYGRKSNPRSHLVFKGKAKYKKYALPEALKVRTRM